MKRQFLNLVLGSNKSGSFSLRRIKTTLFFHPKKQIVNPAAPPPPAVEVAELPEPVLSFGVPTSGRTMPMRFMPLGGSADKIVSTDHEGNVMMYDACKNKLHAMPRLTGRAMRCPISIAAGDALYLIEACPSATEPDQPHYGSFKALIHGDAPDGTSNSKPGWHWHPLPLPPYVEEPGYELKHGPNSSSGGCSRISSWAVVGDSIWVSHDGVGVYAFDTTTREWKEYPVRNLKIPLLGRAEHVPDRDRLFGFRFVASERNQLLCASDLEGKGNTPDTVWEEEAPEQEHPGWEQDLARAPGDWHSHHLAHLGSGRFCTARFYRDDGKRFAVFTGVEVDRGLNMVKHKSLRYNLDDDEPLHWVF